jgi:hypothetical protein
MSAPFELRASARIGASLFATRDIALGALVLRDAECVLRFNAADVAPLDALLAVSAASTTVRSAAAFLAEFRSLPALALSALAVIRASVVAADGGEASTCVAPVSAASSASAVWRCLRGMHAPALPVGVDSLLLYESCAALLRCVQDAAQSIARLWREAAPGAAADAATAAAPSSSSASDSAEACAALLHAVLAMKTNAHRSASDGHWCVFPLASKLAHSCDPNCFFVPPGAANGFVASFVALRAVARGEALTFSYFGGPALLLPTPERRARLLRSHLFVCRCARCDDADDLAGAVAVPCGGCASARALHVRRACPLSLPDADAPGNGSWRCTRCGSRRSDVAVAEPASASPAARIEGDESFSAAIVFDPAVKLKYATIAASVRRVLNSPRHAQTHGHALLAEACRQATVFFGAMCQIAAAAESAGRKRVTSVARSPHELLFCWALRFFAAMRAAGLIGRCAGAPHMLVVSTALSLIDGTLSGSTADDVALPPAATPATGILAVLARHCCDAVVAIAGASGGGDPAMARKVAKVAVLCELDWPFDNVRDDPLVDVLEMACPDEWKRLGCDRDPASFEALVAAWGA